jgi:hypothetical protein
LDTLEGVRFLTRIIATGGLYELENQDPAYPAFSRMVTPWRQWGIPNPDYVYLHAPVHGDYSYRVSGRRGTGLMLAFQIVAGHLARVDTMRIVDNAVHVIDGSGDLSVDADGRFEITLSRQPREGNWLELPEGEAMVAVRNILYDWETEDPAMIFIEREGASYPAPATSPDDLGHQIGRFVEFLYEFPKWQAQAVDFAYLAEPGTIPFPPFTQDTGRELGLSHQYYGQGVYHCEADEAVIVHVTPPRCVYWSFHLANNNWESFDWDLRPTSINGHQAVLDPDGGFRAVISHRDPGVPNWLDASHHPQGLVVGRYNLTDSVPVPQLEVVPLGEVRDHLHPDTATVTPAERSESVRRRMLSVRRIHSF